MMLVALLALAGSAEPANLHALPDSIVARSLEETYAALHAEWEQGFTAWKDELKAARKHGNSKEVKERHPAKTFYARFATLDTSGEGLALLWMAVNVDDAFDDRDEVDRLKQGLWKRVVAEQATAEWAGEIAPQLAKQKRWLESEGVQQALFVLAEQATEAEVAADALARAADLLDRRSSTPEQKAKAKQLRDRILKDYPGTLPAIELAGDAYRENNLTLGKVAPDFDAVDVEGVAFKLSDYRGKVVLLDFWGFW